MINKRVASVQSGYHSFFFFVCPRTDRKREKCDSPIAITPTFLLKSEEPPMCIVCDERLTIEHILLTCSDLIEIREPLYSSVTACVVSGYFI